MFVWKTASAADRVSYLGLRLQSQAVRLRECESYFAGTQPLSFAPPEVVDALQDRISTLNCNYCRLLVDNLVQRITVQGFKVANSDDTDARIAEVWGRNNLVAESKWLIRDFLVTGRSYALAWRDENGNVAVTIESPRECTVYRDPVTRKVLGGLKQWSSFDDVAGSYRSWAVLYEPDVVTTFASDSAAAVNNIPSTSWRIVDTQANPLGEVPLIEFTNRTNVLDFWGTSEFAPIMSLQDGLNKVMLDSLVTSEFYSAPRRWISGFSVPDDEDGNPVNVFGSGANTVWTAENIEAKFGEFGAVSLAGYDTLTKIFTQQISAISGLPEYMVGTGSTNPQSSEAINASEVTLTRRASAKIDLLTPGLADLGRLILALTDGTRGVSTLQVTPVFADLQVRDGSAQTDSFTKLVAAGVPMRIAAKRALGWTDAEAAELPDSAVMTGQNNE